MSNGDRERIIKAIDIIKSCSRDILQMDVIKTYYTTFDLEDITTKIKDAIINEEEVQTSDY